MAYHAASQAVRVKNLLILLESVKGLDLLVWELFEFIYSTYF